VRVAFWLDESEVVVTVTWQVYTPSSPASVGLITRLLFDRNVNFEDDGLITVPSFNHEMDAGAVEVTLQLKRAGLPLITTTSLGATSNAVGRQKKLRSLFEY